jgi:hypothetical protein
MSEFKSYFEEEGSTEKNFAVVFAIVSFLIGLYLILNGFNINYAIAAFLTSVLLIITAFIMPNLFLGKINHLFGEC